MSHERNSVDLDIKSHDNPSYRHSIYRSFLYPNINWNNQNTANSYVDLSKVDWIKLMETQKHEQELELQKEQKDLSATQIQIQTQIQTQIQIQIQTQIQTQIQWLSMTDYQKDVYDKKIVEIKNDFCKYIVKLIEQYESEIKKCNQTLQKLKPERDDMIRYLTNYARESNCTLNDIKIFYDNKYYAMIYNNKKMSSLIEDYDIIVKIEESIANKSYRIEKSTELLKRLREDDTFDILITSFSKCIAYYELSVKNSIHYVRDSEDDNILSYNDIIECYTRLALYNIVNFDNIIGGFVLINMFVMKTRTQINPENRYKFLLTCLMLANKIMDDIPFDNKTFSVCANMSIKYINNLELLIMKDTNFMMTISEDDYKNCIIALNCESIKIENN